jgi:hypothetical protein
MATAQIAGPVTVSFTAFDIPSSYTGSWPRAALTQDTLQKYDLPFENFVVHDAPQTRLPGTAATDDFGVVGATFGTNAITLETLDEKNNEGAHAVYGRTTFRLPPEYVAGQAVQIVVAAGAGTTVASTSMTVDVEAHLVNATTGAVGADLVSTVAQACNSLTAAAKTFTLDASALSPGDKLEIRLAITTNDSATGTAVKGVITNAYMSISIKG